MTKAKPSEDISFEAQKAFVSQIADEIKIGSDRAVVLICGAAVDEVLRRVLQRFLVDAKATHDLLAGGPNAPLGSFSARIKVAEALGLVSAEEVGCLDLIRRIRNDYAHQLTSELNHKKVADRVETLRVVTNGWTSRGELVTQSDVGLKQAFARACVKVIFLLGGRREEIDHSRRKSADRISIVSSHK